MNTKFKSTKHNIYSYDSYDKFLCLKPSPSLIAAILFLCRDFILSILSAAIAFGGAGNVTGVFGKDLHWVQFAAQSPAILLLFILGSRVPTASEPVRWIWKHGRRLLISSAIAQILLLVKFDNFLQSINDFSLGTVLIGTLEISVLIHLLFSQQTKDTFVDFPTQGEDNDGG